jgi:hypothetical protein
LSGHHLTTFSKQGVHQFSVKVGEQNTVIERRNVEITKLKKEKAQLEAELKSSKATLASAVS